MATETKVSHTPGPWKAVLNDPKLIISGHIIKANYDPETPIALLWVGGDTEGKPRQIANARLIAAAPELLAKCEKVVAWLDALAARSHEAAKDTRFITLSEARAADAKNYQKTSDDIREVIRKAKGEL